MPHRRIVETLLEYMAAQREAIAFTQLDGTGPDSPLDRAIQRSALDDRIEALEALLDAQADVEPLEDSSVDPDGGGASAADRQNIAASALCLLIFRPG